MDKARRDKQKEVQTRQSFKENNNRTRRERDNFLNSRAENSPTRVYPERSRTRGRERRDDRNVFNRLSHRRKSVHERLTDTYSPSTTKSGPNRTDSRDPSHSRGHHPRKEHPRIEECFRSAEESYGDTYSQETKTKYRDRSQSITSNRGRTLEVKDEKALPPLKRKVTYYGNHKTNPSDTLPSENRTSEVNQGKDGGLIGLLPLPEHPRKSSRPKQENSPPMLKKQIEELRITKQKLTQSFARVKEITFPPLASSDGTEGSLVIEAEIGGHMIHRMYIDGGSSTEVLYEHCFNQLRPKIKSQMVPATTSLTGFSGETIWPLGQLRLLVTIGDADHCTRAWMNFMIVRSMSPYNGIIGRSSIIEIQAVPSTAHEMLKFIVDGGIVTIRNTILILAECATVITSSKEIPKEAGVRHENFKVAIHPNFPDQEVAIGGTLSAKGRTGLCTLLKENLYIFAWQLSDMTGVPRLVAEHRLNIQDGYSPVRQKKRARPTIVRKPSNQRIVIPFQKLTGKSNLSAATPISVYWMLTKQLVDKAFDNQVGWNIEVYIDDLVIKSYTKVEMLRDIKETFHTLRKINMKLNPKKCMFGAVEGMFLGYMITPEGIKPCLDKTKLVLQLSSPQTIKEKCNKKRDFHWTSEAEQAFLQLNQHLSELPLLVAPKPKEELIIYLSAFYGAVSAVLMTERGMVQTPVYFISRALQGPELKYTPMEKLVISLVFAAKRLQRVATKVERYARRTQYNIPPKDIGERTDTGGLPHRKARRKPARYTSCGNPTGAVDAFTASNNEAEYEALIAGLQIAAQMGVRNIQVSVDSKLVANQVLGTYVAKEENMIKYLEKVKSLVSGFANFSISQIPRSKNKKADALSKIASTSFAHLSKQVLVEVLTEKSIQEKEVTTVVEEEGTTWMTPIVEYLKDGTLPGDRKEASKLRIKARQYELMEGILYRRSFLKPWLRYVGPLQANYVIREIHEGSCSMHAGPRSLADHAPGRKRYDTYVQRLSNTSPRAKKPSATANPDHGSVAVLQMGN
ncbi:reverse transcriptase domain-containing protein [Tanacetum coccineum]